MKRLVIDLDHTLCIPADGGDQPTSPQAAYIDAQPIRPAISKLHEYKAMGFHITIHTARNMRTFSGDEQLIRQYTLPIILDWLERYNVPFDEVVIAKPWCGHEGFYVDDRAVRPSEFVSMSAEQIDEMLKNERPR